MLTTAVSFGSAGPTREAPLRTGRALPGKSRNPGLSSTISSSLVAKSARRPRRCWAILDFAPASARQVPPALLERVNHFRDAQKWHSALVREVLGCIYSRDDLLTWVSIIVK